jgi:hypothetical protein
MRFLLANRILRAAGFGFQLDDIFLKLADRHLLQIERFQNGTWRLEIIGIDHGGSCKKARQGAWSVLYIAYACKLVEEEGMKIRHAVMVLALLLIAVPSFAAKDVTPAFPDAADSIKQPATRMNFNTPSVKSKVSEASFPEGKNSVKPLEKYSVSSPVKPKKPICVGTDCGCSSGKRR